MMRVSSICLLCVLVSFTSGCGLIATFPRNRVTAVPLSPWNQNEPEGIPYYLPKPLLVIAKNVRHVEESQIGLTNPAPIPNTFDNQASYADVKANVTVPDKGIAAASDTNPAMLKGEAYQAGLNVGANIVANTHLSDGLEPEVYYTYQIIFVPDLSQKYGLRIKGGPGEIRAAMNFVNGWMYTGMGPYYLKDSSTAQNLIACGVGAMYAGRGVADVTGEAANLVGKLKGESAPAAPTYDQFAETMRQYMEFMDRQRNEEVVREIPDYAEITVYEPVLTDCGQTEWRMIAHQTFDREYFPRGACDVAANRALIDSILNRIPLPQSAGQTSVTTPSAPTQPSEAPEAESAELSGLGETFIEDALDVGAMGGAQEGALMDPPPALATSVAPAPGHARLRLPRACRLQICAPPEPKEYKTVVKVVGPDVLFAPKTVGGTRRGGQSANGANSGPQNNGGEPSTGSGSGTGTVDDANPFRP